MKIKKYYKYNIDDVLKFLKKKELVYGSREKYYEKRKEKLIEKNKWKIEIIKNCNVDFSKFGWVKKVSVLIELKHQKVNEWMKRYMKDFYDKKCFIRKNGSVA